MMTKSQRYNKVIDTMLIGLVILKQQMGKIEGLTFNEYAENPALRELKLGDKAKAEATALALKMDAWKAEIERIIQ